MNSIGETRCIRAFLEDNRTAIGIAQLPPANAGNFAVWPCAGRHRLISYERLMVAKVAISKSKERSLPIPQVIDFIAGAWLRDAVTRAAAYTQNRVKGLRR